MDSSSAWAKPSRIQRKTLSQRQQQVCLGEWLSGNVLGGQVGGPELWLLANSDKLATVAPACDPDAEKAELGRSLASQSN